MSQKPRPSLFAQFLLRFALLFGALGVGFTWYDAAHKSAPPKPPGTISWERVFVAGACSVVATTLFLLIQDAVRRQNR